uniref:Major facilitator superfamily (MFS) profile domain-containing protein n=2 Tax=Oryza punctata TaxID=4537 RepID=A0A0E0MMB5_ORYPU
MLNIGFQLMIIIAILAAELINYGTAKIKAGWGWRVSLVLSATPSSSPDTPNSLIDRGHPEAASHPYLRRRGGGERGVEAGAAPAARNILRPAQLTMAICIYIPFFQQLTGIDVIMFYAPLLFDMHAGGSRATRRSCPPPSRSWGWAAADDGVPAWWWGTLIAYAAVVVVFICMYVVGFAWSWGPLGWLVSSEICRLEIRA